MTTNTELTKQIDDFGNLVYGKEAWSEDYDITKLKDGKYQASYMDECISNHNHIEYAIQDIEDHIKEN